jgi:FKBP-type peptidyl-prolyl cis-trans isomerase 2
MTNKQIASKKDFIELEFIGKNVSNNEIFDTNILEEAKKINPKIVEVKPLIICIGEGFVVKGLDDYLEGKEVGKKYNLKLSAENAFGKRNPQMVRLIPLKIFLQQKVYPQAGMTLALDNSLVKVISVSGGRVMVDFNNPLSGKDIEYDFTIKKIIDDNKEKVSAFVKFLLGQEFEFDINETTKKIVFKDIRLTPILNALAPKFKEVIGLDVEILALKQEKGNNQNEEIEASKNLGALGKEEVKEAK